MASEHDADVQIATEVRKLDVAADVAVESGLATNHEGWADSNAEPTAAKPGGSGPANNSYGGTVAAVGGRSNAGLEVYRVVSPGYEVVEHRACDRLHVHADRSSLGFRLEERALCFERQADR